MTDELDILESGEPLDPAVSGAMISGERVSKMLEAGETRIADREVNPEKAYANLETAMGMVNNRIGDITDLIDLKKLHFKFFQGNIVGESLDSGEVVLDPIMLMHPAVRMAYALAHELFHQNKGVRNEALVDAMARIYFPEGVMESVYESKKMIDFANTAGIKLDELYQMYFRGEYDEMFDMFTEGYGRINKAADNQGMNAMVETALQEFRSLFPELNYVDEPAVWNRTRPVIKEDVGSELH